MNNDMPPLPDFLNRKLNGIETVLPPRQRQPRTRKDRELLRLWLLNKRGICDGFHRCEFVKRDKWCVTIRVGSKTTNVPHEQWDRAYAKYHGKEYVEVVQ